MNVFTLFMATKNIICVAKTGIPLYRIPLTSVHMYSAHYVHILAYSLTHLVGRYLKCDYETVLFIVDKNSKVGHSTAP